MCAVEALPNYDAYRTTVFYGKGRTIDQRVRNLFLHNYLRVDIKVLKLLKCRSDELIQIILRSLIKVWAV